MRSTMPWTCPFCGRDTTLTEKNVSLELHTFHCDNNSDGWLGLQSFVRVCPNPLCRDIAIEVDLYKTRFDQGMGGHVTSGHPIEHWMLRPISSAKVFPSYIPEPLRQDYEEACAILDLSPKASATLARRCLQGIIRDFWGVSKKRLVDEINELENIVDPLTWKAIDAVRSVGNIGAHMEKEINLIIDVNPDEARLLIGLLETLFKDCYISRHEREEHLHAVTAMADEKKRARAGIAPPSGQEPDPT